MADEEAPPTPVESVEEPKPAPSWEYRSEMKIQGKMREVVKMTIEASEKEIAVLRRKIEKLTYGS